MRARVAILAVLCVAVAACGRNVPREESCNKFCTRDATCTGVSPPTDAFLTACTSSCLASVYHYQTISLECESLAQAAYDCEGDDATECSELLASTVLPGDHCYTQWADADDACGPPSM